jgi:hypothetical protein
MARIAGTLGYVGYGASIVALVACAQIAGVSQYRAGAAAVDGGVVEPAEEASVASEAGDDVAIDAVAPDTGVPEASATGPHACSRGGCNTLTRACVAAGRCYCATDNDCSGSLCVSVPGQNDVSCGTNCTGSGPVDGFNCTLSCRSSTFAYAPSNFTPASYTPPANATTDCNATYNSTSHKFTTGSCAGQAPVIQAGIAQAGGGGAVDILVFKSLTVAGTLTLVGNNPVILAVYGDATIRGTIDASANSASPGAGGNQCAAASTGASTPSGLWEPGAGGGGQAAAGGTGGASRGGAGAPASAPQAATTVPLAGGCAGGLPFVGDALGFSPAAGAGGGAVQISAAGLLDVSSGTIKANGGSGGAGEIGKCNVANYPAQNGTGGAGGGSGGTILLEGSPVTPGATQASGGSGGTGGATPMPTTQAGGVGAAGGVAGAPGMPGGNGTQIGSAPSGCTGGGTWSGGGGGGGSGGVVKTNPGAACLCVKDSDCTTNQCSNASSQCTGTCSGPTAPGSFDSANCAVVNTTNGP